MLEKERAPETKVAVLINGRQNTRIGREAPSFAAQIFAPIAGAIILETTIGQRAPITEVSGSGMTIFDFDASSKAAHEYTALTKEILQWLTNQPPASPASI
jgi:cellulose biosynthesis protein BcsQ